MIKKKKKIKKIDNLAILTLILGIPCIIIGLFPLIGQISTLLTISIGIISLYRIKQNKRLKGKWFAITGIILATFGLFAGVILGISVFMEDTIIEKEYVSESLIGVYASLYEDPYLTDLQKENLWDTNYKGKFVKGTAYVYSVDKHWQWGGVVLADNSPRSKYDLQSDYAIFFKKTEASKLLKIKKGQKIIFEGKLNNYHEILGAKIDITEAILI